MKKFYVSHPRIGTPADTWSKATLKEAVEHAKELVRGDRHGDVAYVVKIVKVVRRQPTPVAVENV